MDSFKVCVCVSPPVWESAPAMFYGGAFDVAGISHPHLCCEVYTVSEVADARAT